MRSVIALSVIAFSFIIAFLRHDRLYRVMRSNEFLSILCRAMKRNQGREMLTFKALFCNEYSSFYGKTPTFNSYDDVFEFISKEFCTAIDTECISAMIKKMCFSSKDELDAVYSDLKNLTDNALEKAKEAYGKYGKTSYVIYPSVCLMALIALM